MNIQVWQSVTEPSTQATKEIFMNNKVVLHYTNGKTYTIKGDLVDAGETLDSRINLVISLGEKRVDNHVSLSEIKEYFIHQDDLAGVEVVEYDGELAVRKFMCLRPNFSVKAHVAGNKQQQVKEQPSTEVGNAEWWSKQMPASSLEVGDTVVIHKDSVYYEEDTEENPSNIYGKVDSISSGDFLDVVVRWENHRLNSYSSTDLVKVVK